MNQIMPNFEAYIFSRHEKEMAIQIQAMEEHKWRRSEEQGYDLGRQAYFEWCQRFAHSVRLWLESLSDEELDEYFAKVPDRIKHYIFEKTH